MNYYCILEESLMNKEVLQALTSHAQEIAKEALRKNGSGTNLLKDVKVNLI